MVTAPASGEKLTILRKIDQTQQIDLPVGGPFPSGVVEESVDRTVMLIQQLQEELNRVVKFGVASGLSEIILPEGAGKGFRWNAGLDGLELVTINEGSDPSLITTIGDLIQGGASGVAERLASVARGDILRRGASKWEIVALGANGKVLMSDGTDVVWALPSDLAITSQAQGDIIFFDGTNWVRLAPGTSGQFLKTLGATADPAWATVSVGGKVLQVVNTQTGAVATGTTVSPDDDTIPQITEGNEFMTLVITPANAANILIIEVIANATHAGGNDMVIALFQDSTANALAAMQDRNEVGGVLVTFSLRHKMVAGTESPTTFRVRIGSQEAGTTTFNGSGGSRKLGGVMASSITITEVEA
jgi:hypothetical protein